MLHKNIECEVNESWQNSWNTMSVINFSNTIGDKNFGRNRRPPLVLFTGGGVFAFSLKWPAAAKTLILKLLSCPTEYVAKCHSE